MHCSRETWRCFPEGWEVCRGHCLQTEPQKCVDFYNLLASLRGGGGCRGLAHELSEHGRDAPGKRSPDKI